MCVCVCNKIDFSLILVLDSLPKELQNLAICLVWLALSLSLSLSLYDVYAFLLDTLA